MAERKHPRPWKRLLRRGLAGCCLALVGAFVLIGFRIGSDVEAIACQAMQHDPGDRIEALLATVDCPDCSLRERNRAVWALGQLGEVRALPVLRPYYTGQACDHRRQLCQRELGKAMQLLEGGVNVTALVWRGGR